MPGDEPGGARIHTNKTITRVTATVVYHDFSAEQGDADFGSEWDAQLEATINPNWMLGLKYAAYRGTGPYPDKAIGWLYVGYRY